jgi:hypothetical protein
VAAKVVKPVVNVSVALLANTDVRALRVYCTILEAADTLNRDDSTFK